MKTLEKIQREKKLPIIRREQL